MSDSPEQFDLDVPGPLAEALRGAYQHRIEIPARVDGAVIAAARQKFDRRRRLKVLARWGAAVSAAAAAFLVAVWLLPHRNAGTPGPNQLAETLKGDIDHSGRLDIVDAMTLARHLRAGDSPRGAWDVNGDGKVDQKDVDALAAASVSLKQQGLAQRRLPTMDDLGLKRVPGKIELTPHDVAAMQIKREDRQ
jgi:hypothetical protein